MNSIQFRSTLGYNSSCFCIAGLSELDSYQKARSSLSLTHIYVFFVLYEKFNTVSNILKSYATIICSSCSSQYKYTYEYYGLWHGYDCYDIISLHIPSSKTSITSWFFTSIGSQPCWPRCLGKSQEIPKSDYENCNILRVKPLNCYIPWIFFRALEHVQEKMLQVDESIDPSCQHSC